MNSATLLDNFDLLAEAPGGVPRLRELILQLAVRGQLVPQEKREGKGRIHHEGHEEHEGVAGGPYAIPRGWRWTTLAQTGKVNPRNEAEDNLEVGFTPMAVISDRFGVTPEYEIRAWRDVKKGFTHFAEGDVGMAKITPCFENGKSAVFRNVPNGIGAGTTELHILRPARDTVIPDYVWVFLKSPHFRAGGESVMTGSAGQKRVPADYFARAPFPLPSLAEQKRIVERVDELMKRCDELEARQKERNERHKVLVSSCLHALSSPPTTDHWPLITAHFPLLFTTPESVAELRKTILQLAVQGRLVPQDPREESGVDCKASRHEARYPPLSRASADLPPWPTAHLSSVAEAIVDCPHETPKWVDKGKICVRTNQLRPGFLDLSGSRYVSEETFVERIQRLRPKEDDILYSREGGILGVACRVPRHIDLCLGQRMMLIRVGRRVSAPFLEMVLNSPLIADIARAKTTGGAAPRVNVSTVKAYPIPVPPLAEQKRIVTKVNELMVLCDALEAKLTQSRADADTLAAAIVHQLCNGSACSEEANGRFQSATQSTRSP